VFGVDTKISYFFLFFNTSITINIIANPSADANNAWNSLASILPSLRALIRFVMNVIKHKIVGTESTI
jgi:hypothetical protein